MRYIGIVVCVFVALLSFARPGASAEVRIGYANLQRALNECAAGVKAKEALKEEAKKLEDELNSRQEELKKLKEEIDKKKSLWNEDTRKQKEQELNAKAQDFQRQYMQYNDDLNKKKVTTEARIIEDLKSVIEEVAKKKGYNYVFEKSVGGLLYAPADADLTDEVIKVYDKRQKAK